LEGNQFGAELAANPEEVEQLLMVLQELGLPIPEELLAMIVSGEERAAPGAYSGHSAPPQHHVGMAPQGQDPGFSTGQKRSEIQSGPPQNAAGSAPSNDQLAAILARVRGK
jgi:hypothetical protein